MMPHVWLGSDVRQAYPCLSAGWCRALPDRAAPRSGTRSRESLARMARTNRPAGANRRSRHRALHR